MAKIGSGRVGADAGCTPLKLSTCQQVSDDNRLATGVSIQLRGDLNGFLIIACQGNAELAGKYLADVGPAPWLTASRDMAVLDPLGGLHISRTTLPWMD
ncbi:hypothetical protein [Rhizobium sp. Rhizsp42]|uniref:hypothetical protein n=1 Tax=Rhizobium sp. Rhizsp42 TaxID=3243034 RepID=UPI0039AFF1A3